MSANLVTNKFDELLATACRESSLPFAVREAEHFIEQLRARINIKRSLLIGSFASRTAVLGYSDIDYLIELADVGEERGTDSILLLLNAVVSDVLGGAPTEIRCPAVVFTLGQNQIDLVPACECKPHDEFPVYLIPDCWKGWQRSSPETHIAAIEQKDRDCGGALRRLIQLAKIWKYKWVCVR